MLKVLCVAVLDCPSCRKDVHLNKEKLDGLPRNLALENIVLRYTEEKRRCDVTCCLLSIY